MALTDTYGTYQKEMEKACNDGRKAAERFQKNLPKMMNEVQPWMKEMMRAIADMSKVSAPQRLVIEVFAWSGVLVLSCSLGSVLGAYILNSVFASMISKFTASVLAYFVIPVAIHASIKHKERQFQSDNNIRRMMVASTFGQGLLVGYTISQRYLSSQPLAFITPISVSFGYANIVQRAKGDRRMILGASLGAAVSANLVLGFLTGQLSSSYEFLALGYVALSGVVMQLLFHNAHWTRGHAFQNVHNAFFVLFKGMTFYCFGTYIE